VREVEGIDVAPLAIEVDVIRTTDDVAIGQSLDTRADLREREVEIPAELIGAK